VPVDGFLPLVGMALTDEFKNGNSATWDFYIDPKSNPSGGTLLGAGGPHYDLALLDTGAGVTLLTSDADAAFGLGQSRPGNSDGFRGTNSAMLTGATGSFLGSISDPLGLYAAGLQGQGYSPLTLNSNSLQGQTNTSVIVAPPTAELPNILGLPYISQYATRIHNDQPLIFQTGGQTVRTPAIEFAPLGSGSQTIARQAEFTFKPGAAFLNPPFYFPGFNGLDDAHEDPLVATGVGGGLFLNVDVADTGGQLNNASFFFDTGASITVVSRTTALSLGFDALTDNPEFTLAVLGSGGTRLNVPGFFVDQFTIRALGGHVTLSNVPVVVLNVWDPSNPPNIVPGILGMNLLAGRNLVIDPTTGGDGPLIYISDPVTTGSNWTAPAASASWGGGGNWSASATPGNLTIANVRHAFGGNQEVVATAGALAWEINVSGAAASQQMTLRVPAGVTATTFSGINIEQHGVVRLDGGALDVQYASIVGGRLTGHGSIATGSGPIPGQVENTSGVVAPGVGVGVGALAIEGRFSNGFAGTMEFEIGGVGAFDQVTVDGGVALDGALKVALIDLGGGAFVPSVGQTFAIITAHQVAGQFSSIAWPTLPADRMWTIAYAADSVNLTVVAAGDFDGNGVINAADRDAWTAGFGSSYGGEGFLAWQRSFGSDGSSLGVPEPDAAALVLVASALFGRRPGRRGRVACGKLDAC